MNLGREASAIVVRLRATATNTNMRELASVSSEMAAVALKPVANFFFMVFLVEIPPNIDRELHEILEVDPLPFPLPLFLWSPRFAPLG